VRLVLLRSLTVVWLSSAKSANVRTEGGANNVGQDDESGRCLRYTAVAALMRLLPDGLFICNALCRPDPAAGIVSSRQGYRRST
jgi:hypothetical protein